jgi:AAA domain
MGGTPYESIVGAVVGIAVALLAVAIVHRVRNRRRPGSSAQASSPGRIPAAPASLEDNWPRWEIGIRDALMRHGWVEEILLNDMPMPLRAQAMRRYVEQHPEHALTFVDDPPRIEPANRARLSDFLHSWRMAWELVDSAEGFDQVIRGITADLCDALGFVYDPEEQRIYRSLHGAVIRAPALRLKVPPRFPLVFVRRHEGNPDDLPDLRSLMSMLDMTSYFALVIDLNDSSDHLDGRRNLRKLVRDTIHDFIVLNGRDLRQILIARDPSRCLVKLILQQVDLTVVSPYVTSGPVPSSMFFGRDHELKTVTRKINDANFALVGGRKIGKTSTLARIYQLLRASRDAAETLYMDCQSVTSHEAFFEAANTFWNTQPAIHSPADLRHYVMARNTAPSDQGNGVSLVILLDEVDTLLGYDLQHGMAIFSTFRELSQERHCRFVLCGERVLRDQLYAPSSPLFNFCSVIQLGPLQEHAARRVILEPMKTMGISIQSQEEVVFEICKLSSCHPNLVQYICQQLILEANARGSHLISPADLENVRHSSSFHEYLLAVTWGNSSPLEQAITLLIIDRPNVSFVDMQELLTRNGFDVSQDELERAVTGLRLYNLLLKEGRQYRLASDVFGEIVHESQEIDMLLSSLRSQAQAPAHPAAPAQAAHGSWRPAP